MAITLAKVMFLDKKTRAFVVDADDIRRDNQTLRDRVDFEDENDFTKSHNYYVKWRDCPSNCEEAHVHSSYYPARILCLAADLAALNAQSFRFPKIAFEDESLSPVASQSSGLSAPETSNDSGDEYLEIANGSDEEYSDVAHQNDSSSDEIDDPRATKKARRLQLSRAKMDIQKRRSLENLRKYHEQKSGKGNPPMAQSVTSPSLPDVEAPNVQPEIDLHRDAADNVPPQAAQLLNYGQQGIRRVHLENPLPPLVRKTRYRIVDDQYIISENLSVDIEVYEVMRMRPFKNANLFIRDSIGLVWSERELACRCLAIERCQKAIPGLRVAEPEKIQLVTTMVCNWYEDDKGVKITQKKRDNVYSQVRRKLCDVIRDKKALFFPHLIRRMRCREDDEGAAAALRPVPENANEDNNMS